MSTADELRALLGGSFEKPATGDRTDRVHFEGICVCGHQRRAHGPSIDGSYPLVEPTDRTVGGRPLREIQVMTGCAGAMPSQTFERFTDESDRDGEVTVVTRHINPTCPCTAYREVVKVDRPHRYFNQRRPTAANRADLTKHPLTLGLTAYRRRLGQLKRAQLSETGEIWADQEFDRRVQWTARVCSECTETAAVFPVFVDDRDRSELRCPAHR